MKHDYRNVEPYLRQKRTKEQELALRQDKNLKEEVNFYSDLAKVVNWTVAMEEAQAELSMKAKPQQARVRRLGGRRILSYAASFLVLVTAGSFWFVTTNYSNGALVNLNEDKLNIAEYNKRTRSATTSDVNVFQTATAAIKNGAYQAAIEDLNVVTKAESTYYSAQLLKAYAAHQLMDYETARTFAEEVATRSSDKLEQQKAEWLIVQNDLAKGETPTNLLQKIATDPTHLFQKEAKGLENKLNNFWRKFLL